MKTISEVFPKDRFRVEYVEREVDSITDKVVFRLDGHQYCMDLYQFREIMRPFDIDVNQDIYTLPIKTVDRRPLWKKDMDMRMGKAVDFSTPCSFITADPCYVQQALTGIIDSEATEKRRKNRR